MMRLGIKRTLNTALIAAVTFLFAACSDKDVRGMDVEKRLTLLLSGSFDADEMATMAEADVLFLAAQGEPTLIVTGTIVQSVPGDGPRNEAINYKYYDLSGNCTDSELLLLSPYVISFNERMKRLKVTELNRT